MLPSPYRYAAVTLPATLTLPLADTSVAVINVLTAKLAKVPTAVKLLDVTLLDNTLPVMFAAATA